ncbi:MAG: hypothetical protein HDT15_12445 [Oscillibacter sp.]|nr:hypothetical protein [Oscillibacter sp.]
MANVELIYQYLEEFSNETIEAYNVLMDRAQEEDIFTEHDIPELFQVLLKVETTLEDERSCNIDWSIKDSLVELIAILVMKYGVSCWADTMAQAINQYTQVTRPFLKTAIDTFISVFLFASTSHSQDESIENRFIFLEALQRNVHNYRELLLEFCERNIALWMSGNHLTREQVEEMAVKEKNPLYGLYLFLKSATEEPICLRDCKALYEVDFEKS